jgi:hypothetical protein
MFVRATAWLLSPRVYATSKPSDENLRDAQNGLSAPSMAGKKVTVDKCAFLHRAEKRLSLPSHLLE